MPQGSFFLSAEEQFLKCKEVCLQDLARQQQITAIRLSHAKVRVAFSLNLVQPFNGSIRKGREKWRLASPIWLFSIGGPGFKHSFEVSLKALPDHRKMLIAEVVMKASVDQNLDCSLHLGELEISAAELLALRPGTRIGFKPPKGLEGVLRVAGAIGRRRVLAWRVRMCGWRLRSFCSRCFGWLLCLEKQARCNSTKPSNT